jgi:DNA-binding LytR/AlgR family response regulator
MTTPKVLNQISQKGNILFVQADQNYSVFHLENGTTVTSGYTLKFHQDYLEPSEFLRINRSLLIHKSYVLKIKDMNNSSYVFLKNGKKVLISRRRVNEVKEHYGIAN